MSNVEQGLIVPKWPVATAVKSLVSTRLGGVSPSPYASLNLGDHVGDDPRNVKINRAHIRSQLPADPIWLQQVHGIKVSTPQMRIAEADASVSNIPNDVLAIMTADCLPVLFANRSGTVIGAAHAGWRGLCAGVLENTIAQMRKLMPQSPADEILAWLGPAIGPTAFEVGQDVVDAFHAHPVAVIPNAFIAIDQKPGKYLANIYLLAKSRLEASGVTAIDGGGFCTVSQPDQFFSYRRDGVTGRFASFIWID
jgi:polyphenol oxidase